MIKKLQIIHWIQFARHRASCIVYCALILALFLFPSTSSAQGIAAYTDYRDYFNVFDKGIYLQLDYLRVRSFKVGGNAVAYIDNTSEFQIYYNGQKYHQVYASDLFSYHVSENIVAYKVGSVAYVFEKGKSEIISYYSAQLFLGDDLLAYYDNSNYNFGVYAYGASSVIENSMIEPPRAVKMGSNLMAFVNQVGLFKIYYAGHVFDVDNVAPVTLEAGRDIVAYVDGYNRYFNLFYNGQTAQVDINQPQSFKVGYGIMAYVDYDGNFRIFDGGSTCRILGVPPEFYEVKGNMILWAYNGEFRTFYNGESVLVEDGIPKEYKLSNDGVAYIDVSGVLKFFYKGKSHIVSLETVTKYFVNNDVVWYQVGVNTWKIFYNGKTY